MELKSKTLNNLGKIFLCLGVISGLLYFFQIGHNDGKINFLAPTTTILVAIGMIFIMFAKKKKSRCN